MNYWSEVPLDDWRDWARDGDAHLPYKAYVRKLVNTAFQCPTFTGKGIVIPAGGPLLTGAWVAIQRLRQLGCALPIEVWHIGADEMPAFWQELFTNAGITLVDVLPLTHKHGMGSPSGWQLKPLAIIFCSFHEVLLIDADNVPAKDPTFLFDAPEYKETGAVFWPDRERHSPDSALWEVYDAEYRDEPQHETGQILINKERCWHALQIAMHANQHSDFHYKHSHGDTATFRFALHALKQPFTVIPHRLLEVPVGRKVESVDELKNTPYLREKEDLHATFLQRDFNGDVIFQHRCASKFNMRHNVDVQHFIGHQECADIIQGVWSQLGKRPFHEQMRITCWDLLSPRRRGEMLKLFEIIETMRAGTIVETGAIRQRDNWHFDAYFSWFLAMYARHYHAQLTVIDIDPQAIALDEEIAGSANRICGDSVSVLKDFTQPIDVLLLDSLDYSASMVEQSQTHALNEVKAALPHLHDKSIIAIDDCGLGDKGGKGGLAVPYLLERGWTTVVRGYMVILAKKQNGAG